MRRTWAAVVAALWCLLLTSVSATAESGESSGLSGSIWQPADGSAIYYVMHPDGTMVVHRGSSIGLGVWEPSGDLLLTGRVDFTRRQSGEWGTLTNRSEWVIDASGDAAMVTSTGSPFR